MDLYVIVSAATGEPLWAAVTDQESAEQRAVVLAVNHGNCNLLNGEDLAEHLTQRVEEEQRQRADTAYADHFDRMFNLRELHVHIPIELTGGTFCTRCGEPLTTTSKEKS
jgi:hypothetical protein